MKKVFVIFLVAILLASFMSSCGARRARRVVVSFSTISVPEEGGISFLRLTTDADNVASPGFNATNRRAVTTNPTRGGVSWYRYPVISVFLDEDGNERIGFIGLRNDVTNVMIRSATQGGGSVQQTFRSDVRNFTFSPDGSRIVFTEFRDGNIGLFSMYLNRGTVTQRISPTGANDNGPSVSQDGSIIFFDRHEGDFHYGLWSFNTNTGLFSNYSHGHAAHIDRLCKIPQKIVLTQRVFSVF